VTTNVYEAKLALFDRMEEEAAAIGGLLDPFGVDLPVQVAYEWPGEEAKLICVYGGGVRLSQEDVVAEQGTLVRELALASVYIRVCSRPPVDVKITDAMCGAIAKGIGRTLKKNPDLGGGLTWSAIREGQGDYSRVDDEAVSILSLQLAITSMFGYEV